MSPKLKFVWHSNAPHSPTGYGNQTSVFVPRIKKAGYEVVVSGFYGVNGIPMEINGIKILPSSKEAYGNDILLAHSIAEDADAVIGLLDLWVMQSQVLQEMQYYNWTPVDHDRVVPAVLERAAHCGIIAMSKDGLAKFQAAGIDAKYVPHGVDSSVFKPFQREQSRANLQAGDAFAVGMFMANKGAPSRKAFDQQIRAFARFQKRHSDALLYLHTDMEGINGENIHRILELAEVPLEAVRTVPQYQYVIGGISQKQLASIYSAMDVVMNATRGEGFGIPIVESQMCGVPVITTNFSAMPEITKTGWSVDYVDKIFTYQGAYQVIPSVDAIEHALEEAYKHKGNEDFRKQARDNIMEYDADTVMGTYWKPVLAEIEKELKPETPASVPTVIRERDYTTTGLWHDGWFHRPAINPKSDVALAWNGKEKKLVHGWGMTAGEFDLDIQDESRGGVAKLVCWEITHEYGLDNLDLKPGSVVFDVGAQSGVVSIYLAKKYPDIKIYAFEPMPQNFTRLQRNIKANGVDDSVTAINKAVTSDGRDVTITGDMNMNAGGANIYDNNGHNKYKIGSVQLSAWMATNNIDHVDLLKLDCEGAEFEIILDDNMLERSSILRGEVHPDFGDMEAIEKVITEQCDDYSMVILGTNRRLVGQNATPDVSIIIPSYNGHGTIQRAIDAALRQDNVSVEVVICDDGSEQPIQDIVNVNSRVRIIRHETNKGQVAAMNTATTAACGRYFLFHGDDDWLETNSLQHLVKALDNAGEKVGFAYGGQQYHGSRNDTVHPPAFDGNKLLHQYYPLNGIMYRTALYQDDGIHWRQMHEKGSLEDWDYCLQVVKAGYTGIKVNDLILHYTLSNSRGWSVFKANEAEVMAAFRETWPLPVLEASA